MNTNKEPNDRAMVDRNAMLNCPFCGPDCDLVLGDYIEDDMESEEYAAYRGRYYVYCILCGMRTRGHTTKLGAIKTFNTRYHFVESILQSIKTNIYFEDNDEWDMKAIIAREYIQEALEEHNAYLHITHHINPETDPLDVEFFWDEKGASALAKTNLRDEYLEVFNENPAHYAALMPGVVAALRKLADEIEAINQEVHNA